MKCSKGKKVDSRIRTSSRSILLLNAMSLVTNDVSMKERGIGTNCIWSIDSILHPVRFMIYFSDF